MGEWTVQRCLSSCLSRKIPLRVDAESLCKRLVSCQVVLNDTPVGQKMKPVQTSDPAISLLTPVEGELGATHDYSLPILGSIAGGWSVFTSRGHSLVQ